MIGRMHEKMESSRGTQRPARPRGAARATLLVLIASAGSLVGPEPVSSQTSEAGPGGAAQDAELARVIDAVLDAYGGVERLRGVEAIRQEGQIRTSSGGHGIVVRISRGGTALSSLVHYQDRVELRILEDGSGWRGSTPATLEAVQGPLLVSMEMQAARILAPWFLDSHRNEVRRLPDEEDLLVLSIGLGEGRELRLWIDPAVHHIVRSTSLMDMGPMTLTFTSRYDDFRLVDGVLIPHAEENSAQGTPTSSVQLGRVLVNPTGDDLVLPAVG